MFGKIVKYFGSSGTTKTANDVDVPYQNIGNKYWLYKALQNCLSEKPANVKDGDVWVDENKQLCGMLDGHVGYIHVCNGTSYERIDTGLILKNIQAKSDCKTTMCTPTCTGSSSAINIKKG